MPNPQNLKESRVNKENPENKENKENTGSPESPESQKNTENQENQESKESKEDKRTDNTKAKKLHSAAGTTNQRPTKSLNKKLLSTKMTSQVFDLNTEIFNFIFKKLSIFFVFRLINFSSDTLLLV